MRCGKCAFVFLIVIVAAIPAATQTPVFINEIHYDNASTDVGEAIEIAGPAGTDLSGWSLVLYNGNGGAPYDTTALFGTISDTCGGYGALDFTYPTNGIQNGSPDGIALVDSTSTVVQFLSYEGSFVAVGGPADGLFSTDIGVAEGSSTAVGDSLQLLGTGLVYEQFTWASPAPSSFGSCNPGQTFASAPNDPVVNEFVANHAGTDTFEFIEVSGDPATDYSAWTVLEIEGDGTGAGTIEGVFPVGITNGDGLWYTGFLNNQLENGSLTFLLVEGFSGSQGDDIDSDNDGVIDFAPWSRIGDSLANDDGTTGDLPYSPVVLTAGFDGGSFTVGGASRIPNGTDTDSVDDWVRNDFDGEGLPGWVGSPAVGEALNTPELINEVYTVPPILPDLVINEIHADPDSTNGDANGDGTANYSADEFVEIVNVSGSAIDISGWTLADGFTVRHTFPPGTVIEDQCGIVVFGGGNPAGSFGGFTVQTASTGSLGLNNGGDIITLNDGSSDAAVAVYGSEGGDNQSLTLDPDLTGALPYVKHTLATGSGGTLFSPGTRIDGSSFGGCPSPWVINEVHADPDGTIDGDANGDGVRNSSQDEFIEIVNNTGDVVDISGWTLSDAFSVRHTFPAGTMVLNGCSVVVFGGGSPTGTFGNSLVQTASTGALGLNNSGDDITLNDGSSNVAMTFYGSEGGDNQSLTLDPDVVGSLPYVKHTLATGSGGTLFSPGTRIDSTQFAGCPVSAEIFEIQGAGAASPFAGSIVMTMNNVVTALAPNGFFMQTPTVKTDGIIDTSDGIFVFTGGAPAVAVGNLVSVTGQVDEFFGFTEITGAVFTLNGTGAVPTPVILDSTVPSPDPTASSCALEYECYEGMLVDVADGTVTGPNQRFGTDPVAEVHITAAPARTFREPGIEFPGLAGLPVWDGNPEVFELDPDKLGLTNMMIPAGSSFSAVGVIGFEFGGYELWPTQLDVNPVLFPLPVRDRVPMEFTIGSLNMFRFFDDIDDPPTANANGEVNRDDFVVSTAEYERRRVKFVSHILDILGAPDILAVQEVEKIEVLQDLAADIAAVDPGVLYTAHLIEGNDVGTIDVGFLTRDTIAVDAVTQFGYTTTLTYDGSLLNDRPPLMLEARCIADGSDSPVKVIVVHGRSLSGIDNPSDGPRVRQKRLEQAQFVAQLVQDQQLADPNVELVVVGDFNAYEFTDGYVDVVGQIAGDFDPADNLLSDLDLVDPNLTKRVLTLPADERYSFIFRGNAQALDHALTSSGVDPRVTGFEFGRGNADAAVDLINDGTTPENLPLRSSDHDGLVLFLTMDLDGDGVVDNLDFCPGTIIPESVPTHELGTNRWALVDDDGTFDTTPPNGKGKGLDRSFTIEDTAGCSCEQIIDELHLGQGHVKYGCSTGVMENWIEEVTD